MIILRIFANAVIMAGEVAAVAALAAFAFYYPFVFAGVTAALSFVLGLRLEVARLRYELPFYFGGLVKRGDVLHGAGRVRFEALFKGVLAGVAALFTFAGTNPDRLFWVAVLFGVCVYAGAAVLRLLSIRAEALPMRWGYFRLAPPLGLLFSAGLALLAAAAIAAGRQRHRHRLGHHLRYAGAAVDRAGERAVLPAEAGVRRVHRQGA